MLQPGMFLRLPACLGALASLTLLLPVQQPVRNAPPAAERFWPQWRGPHATGVSTTATPPTEWSDTKNIRWKVEIPGRGSASPVIWGDRIFLLTAVPSGVALDASHAPRGNTPSPHKFLVLALDRATGKVVWERTAREEAPHESSHPENGTWASSSAITNGEIVIASFESRGLYAYDMSGTPLWQTDLGDKAMRNHFGEGSTPVLHGHTLIVVWDHTGESFVTALDARTGKEIWRQKRDEIDTWATPLVLEQAGRAQVVVPGMNRVQSYDLATGAVVWHTAGLTMNPIPSPVADDSLVYLMSGFRGNSLKAIKFGNARGDITGTDAVAWTLDRDTPYVPSPLLYDGVLYFLKSNTGILSAYDARTGKPHFQVQRLPLAPEVFASPVGAAGRVYIPSRDGVTLVLRHGPTFDVIAQNKLSDGFDASPALAGNEIYLRGYKYLYSIAAD
jgi:outer membrane protein assembly factor BamB